MKCWAAMQQPTVLPLLSLAMTFQGATQVLFFLRDLLHLPTKWKLHEKLIFCQHLDSDLKDKP